MTLKARTELMKSLRGAYSGSSGDEKKKLLDGFVEATGYHRKYAIRLLRKEPGTRINLKRGRVTYGDDVVQALLKVWTAAFFICSKRLEPFMPELVDSMERHGHLQIAAETREKLLAISSSTIDRLLRAHKKAVGRPTHYAKNAVSRLRSEITVRTFADWEEKEPGYCEIDLVAHNGGNPHGQFCHSLVLTDVFSAYTDFTVLLNKEEDSVIAALEAILARLPFALKGIDVDNGSEFLNHKLAHFCAQRAIRLTRGRPYRKNDQCYVEEKNGSIIRRHVGYRRFEGPAAQKLLLEIYARLRLFVNYFQPSQKLQSKARRGSKVTSKYSRALTPVARLLACPQLEETQKERMRLSFKSFDPVEILAKIDASKQQLVALKVDSKLAEVPKKANHKGRPRGSRNKKRDALLKLVHEILCANPAQSATCVKQAIDQKSSGTSKNPTLATIQRLIREWRDAHPEFLHLYPQVYKLAVRSRNEQLNDERSNLLCIADSAPPETALRAVPSGAV